MATSQGISPSRLSQCVRFIHQEDTPRAGGAEMFAAALALARIQVTVDGDVAPCASCQAIVALRGRVEPFPRLRGRSRVLKAWGMLCSKVRRKPAVSATVLSPLSAA
jgi:hypothetical protein